jgi:hypothetical protein
VQGRRYINRSHTFSMFFATRTHKRTHACSSVYLPDRHKQSTGKALWQEPKCCLQQPSCCLFIYGVSLVYIIR